jgi:microcystin-dependent protein
MLKKIMLLWLCCLVPMMAKPTELLIEKKIAHETKGNLKGYKTVEVHLYEQADLETSLWTETHDSVRFYNGNMQLSVGAVKPFDWTLFNGIRVPIIGLKIDGEMIYIEPSGEIFSHISGFARQAGSVDYKHVKNVPLVATDMIENGAVTFEKLNLTKQNILDLGINSHSESDVLTIVQKNPSSFNQNINGDFYESIENESINNLTSAGYAVSAQNGAISGVFHAHKDVNGVGRVQMGSKTKASVDVLYNNATAISINEHSVVFNKPFNLYLAGAFSAGDLLVFDGSNWSKLGKGSANQVLGSTGSGLGWISQTASDYIEGEDKKQFMEVRTLNNSGGSYAGFRASADSGNIKGVFQAHKKSDTGNTIEMGSTTNHDVVILRKGQHAVTITLNEDGEIVVKANKLEVENIKADSIDTTNLNSNSLTTSELSSTTSSLGTASSTSLETENIDSKTSSIGNSIATSFEIEEKVNALSVPPGTILPFVGEDVPDGYVLCNGQMVDAISNNKYLKLFGVIGTKFGGYGPSNFRVPDLRSYFLRGASATSAFGTFQADATALNGMSASSSKNGEHSHYSPYAVRADVNSNFTLFGKTGSSTPGTQAHAAWSGNQSDNKYAYTSKSGNHTHTITLEGDTETRPKNMSVNYIIKY